MQDARLIKVNQSHPARSRSIAGMGGAAAVACLELVSGLGLLLSIAASEQVIGFLPVAQSLV